MLVCEFEKILDPLIDENNLIKNYANVELGILNQQYQIQYNLNNDLKIFLKLKLGKKTSNTLFHHLRQNSLESLLINESENNLNIKTNFYFQGPIVCDSLELSIKNTQILEILVQYLELDLNDKYSNNDIKLIDELKTKYLVLENQRNNIIVKKKLSYFQSPKIQNKIKPKIYFSKKTLPDLENSELIILDFYSDCKNLKKEISKRLF